ncbi:hypothetical protein [Metabacillus litoralis]|uniref:hypothetical protein n=1 Tax=Metabacillus litoralis TaxID=152268 RepID=UPI001CFD77BE|nr:hypothetical protein [Metabacillus litoralis]
MHLYLFTIIGFLILVPILLIVPIGINKKGKLIISGVALLCAAMFTFTTQVIPVWQSALAIFALIAAVAYLLRDKLALFETEAQDEDEEELVWQDENENDLIVEPNLNDNHNEKQEDFAELDREPLNETSYEEIDSVVVADSEVDTVTTIQTEKDDSSNEQEQNFLEDFFDTLDSRGEAPHQEIVNKEDESEIYKETAATIEPSEEKEEEINQSSDDFLTELFEGRNQVEQENDDHEHTYPVYETPKNSLDITEDATLNDDLFESLLVEDLQDVKEEDSLHTSVEYVEQQVEEELLSIENDHFEFVDGKNLDSEGNIDNSPLSEIVEVNSTQAEDMDLTVENNEEMEKDTVTTDLLPNDVLDMLLSQFKLYKKSLTSEKYEHVLKLAIAEAKSPKDQFLFSKELLLHYQESSKYVEYDVFLSEMREKLEHYPLLVEQLTWIKQSN